MDRDKLSPDYKKLNEEISDVPLCETIRLAQDRDDNAMLLLINRFDPLLRKHARHLKGEYEEAYAGLVADFTESIYSLRMERMQKRGDGSFVNYFAAAIYHAYARRLRYQIKQIPETVVSNLTEAEQAVFNLKATTTDTYFQSDILGYVEILTDREIFILRQIYAEDISIAEIAAELGVSRQTVNQTKNRALHKLRTCQEISDSLS